MSNFKYVSFDQKQQPEVEFAAQPGAVKYKAIEEILNFCKTHKVDAVLTFNNHRIPIKKTDISVYMVTNRESLLSTRDNLNKVAPQFVQLYDDLNQTTDGEWFIKDGNVWTNQEGGSRCKIIESQEPHQKLNARTEDLVFTVCAKNWLPRLFDAYTQTQLKLEKVKAYINTLSSFNHYHTNLIREYSDELDKM